MFLPMQKTPAAVMRVLLEFIREAKEAGADRVRYCDTVGVMTPLEYIIGLLE